MQERTWAEISLDNIEFNYRSMRAHLKDGAGFLGVVKANAYGHGAVPVAKRLETLGCDYLAVATVDEALELRENGIKSPILILGYTDPRHTQALIDNDITQSISALDMAHAMSEAASAYG